MIKLHNSIERVSQRLEALYACGLQADGTHSRMAFSPEDQKGRALFASWFEALGLPVHQDSAGNLIARLEGRQKDFPPIVIASHLDTVPDGGRYDGALGCVAGLEVCETLLAAGIRCEHPIEVIVFSDEEGFRFSGGLMGSTAFCGEKMNILPEDVDVSGQKRSDVYRKAGIEFARIAEAERAQESVHCCIELHIEQGSSLDQQQLPLGIVSTIAGVRRIEVSIEGEANHSGSTRMDERKDALVAAASFIASLPKMVEEVGNAYTVATVGTIKVEPSAVNVIPGRCIFSLEIRDQSLEVMQSLTLLSQQELEKTVRRLALKLAWKEVSYHAPMPMSDSLKALIIEKAEADALPYTLLPSGAFHDSLLLAGRFPTAMIFVASVDGKSHCKEEYSRVEDIEKGIDLLIETVISADQANFACAN